MASSAREAFGRQQQAQQPKGPREAVMQRLQQMGIDVPVGMENDPGALLKHIIESGQVPQAQSRLSMAQQAVQQMFGRR